MNHNVFKYLRRNASALLIAAGLSGMLHAADGFTLLNYQGIVEIEGGAYYGDGYFAFAFGDEPGTTNLWSNDGTAVGMPGTAVRLDVTNGFFHTALGDTGLMAALPRSLMAETNLYLSIWFTHVATGPFYRLGPAQHVLPVPSAVNADMLDGYDYAGLFTNITDAAATNISEALAGLTNIYVFKAGDDMSGVLGMGNNTISNLAAGTEWHMAVNLGQLTNETGGLYLSLDTLSNYIATTMIRDVANLAYLTGLVNDIYVNVDGDTMIGPLTLSNTLVVVGGAVFGTDVTMHAVLSMDGHEIINIAVTSNGTSAVNYTTVTNLIARMQAVSGAYVRISGDDMTGVLGLGDNNIVNLADGVTGDMAVNLRQLTNSAGGLYVSLNTLSNYIATTMIKAVANYAYLTGQVNDTYVNVDGDTMTGPLTLDSNLVVKGDTVLRVLVVSNSATFVTNVTVKGLLDMSGYEIVNLPATSNGASAVNYTTVTNLIAQMQAVSGAYVRISGDDMTGVLGLGDNNIVNLADGTTGDMAVNLRQLTNSAGGLYVSLNTLSNYIATTMIKAVANYAYLTGQVNDTYVNVDGDTMTGPLTLDSNLVVKGDTVLRVLVVSNNATFVTNVTVKGLLDMSGYEIVNLPATSNGTSAVNYTTVTNLIAQMQAVSGAYVRISGDDMTGVLGLGDNNIVNLADGTTGDMAVNLRQLTNSAGGLYVSLNTLSNYIATTMIKAVANYAYLTGQVNDTYVNVSGDTMTGPLDMGGNTLTNLPWPTVPTEAATKGYVDAMQTNVVSLVSGECDTNRVDVLFSTNYIIRNVCIWQPVATNQAVFLYTNSVPLATLPFAATTDYQPVNVTLGRFDRLGIACSNLNSVVQFCFEGNRQ